MAVDCFLKLDGVRGGSTDARHKDEIELLAFTFAATQSGGTGSGGGGAAGKVQISGLSCTAVTGRAGPQLFQLCAEGKHVKQALLTVRKAGRMPFEFVRIKLEDVVVSSYSVGGGEADGLHDAFSLGFKRISYDFVPQKPDGSADTPVHSGWDLGTNKKI
jgi:type VI secretion system secreted protein Hcp